MITPDVLALYARLTDYELAMIFREVALAGCASRAEADARQVELDQIGAVMDHRDVRLEDWARL